MSRGFWQDFVDGIGSTYTDSSGRVHTTTTRRMYDPSLDPWLGVRNLVTCPSCGVIGRHKECGNPKREFQKLLDRGLDGPAKCASCHEWSVAGSLLLNGKRYAPGERVPCPEYLIPGHAKEEER